MHDHLTPLAQALGRTMAERCEDGMPGHFGDGLLEDFRTQSVADMRAALAELEAEGLVDSSPLIGPKLPRIRTTTALFIACDAAITGEEPVADSVLLAKRLLDDPNLAGNARDLHTASGWERRRFNPAFALLVPLVAPGRVRNAYQNDYSVMGLLFADADLIQLRRYVERVG